MTPQKALKSLKPVYLIYGEEKLLLDEAVGRAKQIIVGRKTPEFSCDVFYAGKDSINSIISSAETYSFLSEKRLVILKEAEKLSELEISRLSSYLENPSPSTCLILVAGKLKKNHRLISVVRGKGEIREYKPPPKSCYPHWVVKEFGKRGKSVSLTAGKILVERIGFNLYALTNEIEKISLFYKEKKKIELEEIDFLVKQTLSGNIFDFLNAVSQRNKKRAIELLNYLLESKERVPHIFYLLVNHLRLLLKVKSLIEERRFSEAKVAKELNLPIFQVTRFREDSRNFSFEELKNAFKLLLEMDVSLKTETKDVKLLLERLLIKIL